MSTSEGQLPDLLPQKDRKPALLRLLWVAGALVFFALGVVGWLVPVVTGVPFYIVGFLLLAGASERVRLWLNRVEKNFPIHWRWKLRYLLKQWRDKRERRKDEDAAAGG